MASRPPSLRQPWQKPRAETERERLKAMGRAADRNRASARDRGYDAEWYAFRDAVVIERGCRCERCKTLVVLRKREATKRTPVAHVDHIRSVQSAPHLRLDPTNVRVLCKPCHDARTGRDQGFGRTKRNG
ncbi:HNH endonuclease signature motif containing protein [Azospirillum argentinense]